MNKSYRNMPKFILTAYLIGFMGFSPALAVSSDIHSAVMGNEAQTKEPPVKINDSVGKSKIQSTNIPKEVELRGLIDDGSSGIKLKGGINIDKNNQIISLTLRDSDIKQVLRMIADKAKVNIVFDKSVEGTITLDLVNVTLNKAFEYVMTIGSLTYWQDGNSLIVASKEASSLLSINKTQLKPIQIKYLDAKEVANFLNTNIFSINKPDISVSQVVISNPRTNQILILGNENDYILAKKTVDLIDVKPLMEIFDVNYTDPEIVASNICLNVFNEEVQVAGSSGGATVKTGSKIVCSSVAAGEGSASAGGLGAAPQSLVTTGFLVMADFDHNQITISGSKEQLRMAEELINIFDKKQPQVYIEISIIELSESGSKSLSSTMSANLSTSGASFSGTSTTITDASGIFRHLGGSKHYDLVISTIEALISERKGKVLSNPRIIATHNKTSTVNISSDFVESRKVENTIIGNSIVKEVTYELGSSGITMSLTPRVSPNGYVTLNVIPSYTAIKEQVKEGEELIATLLNRRDLNLQDVRIKDGETLVVGGLIQETDTNDTKKVPILGDLPVLGILFRNSSTDRTRSELILMITPKILKEEDSMSAI